MEAAAEEAWHGAFVEWGTVPDLPLPPVRDLGETWLINVACSLDGGRVPFSVRRGNLLIVFAGGECVGRLVLVECCM